MIQSVAERKLLLIMNPRSGMQQAEKYVTDMISLFMRYGYRVEVVITRNGDDAVNYARTLGAEMDLIVCVGGDGTLNQTVHGMMDGEVKTPLGYIPAGSTNDFAATLKLSSNVMTAAEDIMRGQPKPLDVGRFGNRYFCYCATFGAFTRSSYDTPQSIKNALGHLAYVLNGVKELTSLKYEWVRIETDDCVLEGEYLFGGITNATSVGGVITLDPQAVDLSDGLFEILLIKKIETAEALYRTLTSLSLMQYDPAVIDFVRTRQATIYTPDSIPWSLDGEYFAGSEIIHVENANHALHLMVNSETAE